MSYYDQPSYTMMLERVLDHDMAELTGAELRVLLYIVRHTRGYGKTAAAISYKQFLDGTGLRSRSHLAAALASLERTRRIYREHATTVQGDADVTSYRLRGGTGGGGDDES